MSLKSFADKVRQYAITVSRMSALQILWRIRKLIVQQLWKFQKRTSHSCSIVETALSIPTSGFIPSVVNSQNSIQYAEQICKGEFSFLNQLMVSRNQSLDWNVSPGEDRLWAYNLNYFDFAYSLLWAYHSTGQQDHLDCLLVLINDWIDKNPFWKPIPWNPYPLSKRLIVWTTLLGHLKDDNTFQTQYFPKIITSICQQANFLSANVEYDVDNNHLIANARALVWAGLFLRGFPKAQKWFEQGITLLERETCKQILADGGHYERSSSYQLVVLQDLLETALLLKQCGVAIPDVIAQAIPCMFDWLAAIIKPDGSLPMLNDTVMGYPVEVGDMLAVGAVYLKRADLKSLVTQAPGPYPEWLFGVEGRTTFDQMPAQKPVFESLALADTGYYVLRGGKDRERAEYLVFDCGLIGPRHSPAHAHADTLSFELVAYGQTLLIDPGVYEYKAGEWRDYFRATMSHNTVTVDELDQSVFWGSFRVAEMAEAKLLQWWPDAPQPYVEGEHNGYRRLKSPVLHRRKITWLEPYQWLIVDTLKSDGRAAHRYDLWFHLTPAECAIDNINGVCRASFSEGVELTFHPEHPVGTETQLQEGWISYTWKQKIPAPVLRYSLVSSEATLVFTTRLVIRRD